MKTIVYLTINLVNFKIYVGVHDCEDPYTWDYYCGDGCFANQPSTYMKKTVPLACALRKYGPNNFRRITLAVFDNRQDALWLERVIVNEEFIKREDTYNITLGGGDPPTNTVKFYQYDLDGNFVKEWENMAAANKFFEISHDRILNAIKDKKSCANSYWSYEKYDKLNLESYTYTNRGYIKQYAPDGTFLNEFSSIRAASQALDIPEETISNSVFRKSKSTGYYFIRANEDIKQVIDGACDETLLFYCYDADGNLYKKYNNIADAIKDLPKAVVSGLKRAIFKEKAYNGFYWSQELYKNFHKKEDPKKVSQYDLDGNLVKIWDSVGHCKTVFSNVARVLSGQYKQTKGFTFKYTD